MGVIEGIDDGQLDQAGWGVIFPAEGEAELREALAPLLALRREQAGELYRELVYRPGESMARFLARYGVAAGPADPRRGVPYYLLIAGSPEAVPLRTQIQLGVQRAVGRACFADAAECRRYAEGVLRAEGRPAARQRAAVVAPGHPDDQPTARIIAEMAEPLAAALAEEEVDLETAIGAEATRARLLGLLGESLDLLVFAGHGVGFPSDDERQAAYQGALLCANWSGPKQGGGPLPLDIHLSADDIGDEVDLSGLIALIYASYGAASSDELRSPGERERLGPAAPRPFMARLPQRLLGVPGGGALAVVGLIDRAWGSGINYEHLARALLAGRRVGAAMEDLSQRYAALASELATEVENIKFGKVVDGPALAGLWASHNDVRSTILVGDPAVRLRAGEQARRLPRRYTKGKIG